MNTDDSVLAYLALSVEKGNSIRLALKVGGLWIAGIAVSPQEWVDELEHSMTPETADVSISIIREVIEQEDDHDIVHDFNGTIIVEHAPPAPIFINLKNSEVLSPTSTRAPFQGLFRCTTSEVSAWILQRAGDGPAAGAV